MVGLLRGRMSGAGCMPEIGDRKRRSEVRGRSGGVRHPSPTSDLGGIGWVGCLRNRMSGAGCMPEIGDRKRRSEVRGRSGGVRHPSPTRHPASGVRLPASGRFNPSSDFRLPVRASEFRHPSDVRPRRNRMGRMPPKSDAGPRMHARNRMPETAVGCPRPEWRRPVPLPDTPSGPPSSGLRAGQSVLRLPTARSRLRIPAPIRHPIARPSDHPGRYPVRVAMSARIARNSSTRNRFSSSSTLPAKSLMAVKPRFPSQRMMALSLTATSTMRSLIV